MLEICCSYKIISLSNLISGGNENLTYPPEIIKGMIRRSIFATFRECGDYEIRSEALEMIGRYVPRPDRNKYVQ